MRAKEYLSKIYYLEEKIYSKLRQIKLLEDMAEKCTASMNETPQSTNSQLSKVAKNVEKIVDLQAEIGRDINESIRLKRRISEVIKAVEKEEYQVILEKRYLCFMSWREIAEDMGYSKRHIYKLHNKALSEVSNILKDDTK